MQLLRNHGIKGSQKESWIYQGNKLHFIVAHFKYHLASPQINKKYTQWLRIYIR
jgi:hypothetical protein